MQSAGVVSISTMCVTFAAGWFWVLGVGCHQARNLLTPKRGGIGSRWHNRDWDWVHMLFYFRTQWEATGAKGYEYLSFPKETVNLFILSFCMWGKIKQVKDTQDSSRPRASTVMINNEKRETWVKERKHSNTNCHQQLRSQAKPCLFLRLFPVIN